MSQIKLNNNFIRNTVKIALNEDLYPSGDITSSLVKNKKIIKVKLTSNQNAIIGGLVFARQVFSLIDNAEAISLFLLPLDKRLSTSISLEDNFL